MRTIPTEVLESIVSGVNLMPGTLADQLGGEPQLLVFLRHFGCMFCRETIAELREASETVEGYPAVLFFHQGRPAEGRAFMRRYWPAARAIADPELRFYGAFGVDRGGLMKMFGPGVWTAKRRAEAKGHANAEREGDIWRMPGVFLAQGDRILWRHEFRHAADHPDFLRIPERIAASG